VKFKFLISNDRSMLTLGTRGVPTLSVGPVPISTNTVYSSFILAAADGALEVFS
jgi:hypothetical protein